MVLVPRTNGTEIASGSLEKKLVFQVLFFPKKFQFQFTILKNRTWFWLLKNQQLGSGFYSGSKNQIQLQLASY
jgi:hypothetical protein